MAITITHLLLAKEVGACVTDTPPFFRDRMIALGSSPSPVFVIIKLLHANSKIKSLTPHNRPGGVIMVSVVDLKFNVSSGKTKDYIIGIC